MNQRKLPLEGGHDHGPLFNQTHLTPAKPKSRGVIRNAWIKKATPPWADRAAIRRIYKKARRFSEVTGKRFSVDHLIPLKHPLVCGLHVPNNLRVMLEKDNQKRGNRWHPDQVDIFGEDDLSL